jgi:small subunit ribosomal protein S7
MRRAGAAKREVLPDPKYGSRLVAKFVNIMMICGKKSTAEQIMYAALVSVEDRSKQDALKMFKSAIDNVKPAVEVKSRRVGGSTYQVPVEVRPDRRTSLGHRGRPSAWRAEHGGKAGRRAARCRRQSRHRGEEARRHAQDGGGQQGVRALSLVARPT